MKELVYLWINNYGCLQNKEFNFSPKFIFSFDERTRELKKTTAKSINIFQKEKIVNLTAIVGENGSGKTTLLNFLKQLDLCPIPPYTNDEYSNYYHRQHNKRRYIAVYIDNGEEKVYNTTEYSVKYMDKNVDPLVSICESKISHIYFTNSEYTEAQGSIFEGYNATQISLENASLRTIANGFYKKAMILLYNDFDEQNKFDNLHKVLLQSRTINNFQQILDIIFYNRIKKRSQSFIGKQIKKVRLTFNNLAVVLQKADKTALMTDEEICSILHNKLKVPYTTIRHEPNLIVGNLVLNLAFELAFNFGFELPNGELSLDQQYKHCKSYILDSVTNQPYRNYYLNAIEEIDNICNYVKKEDKLSDNLLPVKDLFYRQYCTAPVSYLGNLFEKVIKSESGSFIAKYINVYDLEMASGERALLNMMSRIELLDFFAELSREKYQVQDDVLLLIDEIDLYMHPDWQKKIIKTLIEQISTILKDKNVQIILTTHSPIVLSDIPRENSIYMRTKNNELTVESGREHEQTFAANIYSLFKDAFFIKDGLGIGEYAIEKINELTKMVKYSNPDNLDEKYVRELIEIIGEPIIKNKLKSYLGEKRQVKPVLECDQSENNEKYIEFLENQKQAIECEIRRLKGESND